MLYLMTLVLLAVMGHGDGKDCQISKVCSSDSHLGRWGLNDVMFVVYIAYIYSSYISSCSPTSVMPDFGIPPKLYIPRSTNKVIEKHR